MAEVFYPEQTNYIEQLNNLVDSITLQQSYYGPLPASPTTRLDGSPCIAGDRYFNTTINREMTWDGTVWSTPDLSSAQLASPVGATYVGYTSPIGTVGTADAKLKQLDTLTSPQTQNKKIVVFGSSVAFGYGATSDNGWAKRLGVAMAARGYTMVNKSVGGNNTAALISRFYTDVVPENPGIVIIGLSLGNEGLAGSSNKESVYSSYLSGMRRLVSMCREMGYKVVVTGVYSNNGYTAADYQYLLQADQELENSDIPYINFLGAVDDGTGKWRTGMWLDALHPNDAGHEAMFRAFPLSLFDNLLSSQLYMPVFTSPYTLNFNAPTAGVIPVGYVSESPFGSFTIMCRIRRKPTGALGKPVICIESSLNTFTAVRVRNQLDDYYLAVDAADVISSDTRSSSYEPIHITITYDYFTGTWRLYADGVLKGSYVFVADSQNYNRISFGNRIDSTGFSAEGYEYSEFGVWRTALNAEQIVEAMNGRYSKGSINLLSPVVDAFSPQNSRLVNLAPSTTFALIGAAGTVSTLTANTQNLTYKKTVGGRGFAFPADTTFAPIRYTVTAILTSFTALCTVRRPPSGGFGKALLGIANAGTDLYRLRFGSSVLVELVNAAGTTLATAPATTSGNLPFQIAMTYDRARGTLEVFLEGVSFGVITVGVITVTDILFAGLFGNSTVNPSTYEFSNIAIYGAVLSSKSMTRAADGDFRVESALVVAPGYEKQYITNSELAPGLAYKGTVTMPSIR